MILIASSSISMILAIPILLILVYVCVGVLMLVTKSEKPTKKMLTHCPECNSTQIEYVSEYHKCLSLRILGGVSMVLAVISIVIMALNNTEITDVLAVIIFGILVVTIIYAIVKLFITLIESKTHIRCICRSCGHSWTVN